MHFITSVLIASLFLSSATSNPASRARRVKLPQRRAPTVPIVASDHVLQLKRKRGPSISHSYLESIRLQYGQAPLANAAGGQSFLTNISFGAETFGVVVDTGSSDTWLATNDVTCVDITDNSTIPVAQCDFGPLYTPSSTLQVIDNVNFNITYGDGEYLNGDIAYEDVTLAGINVTRQEVGIVTLAGWQGDGVSSGLLGLAFPAITSAFSGDDPADDSSSNADPYSPIFTTMYRTGLVDAVFSVALDRDESGTGNGGLLAIGGIPSTDDVTGGYGSTFTTTPIEALQIDGDDISSNYTFYTIQIDGISYGIAQTDDGNPYTGYEGLGGRGRHSGASGRRAARRQGYSSGLDPSTIGLQLIVDTGTTLNYINSDAAYNFNSLWSPSAFTSNDPSLAGLYLVECTATPPAFDVVINGQTLSTNPTDLILNIGDERTCLSGIQDGGGEAGQAVFILGDVWLKNVLAVFNVGNGTMQFASRVEY